MVGRNELEITEVLICEKLLPLKTRDGKFSD